MQGDRVFHRQLGARTDGEMRGVHRVARQHDIVERPVLAGDVGKLAPVRPVPDDPGIADIRTEQVGNVGDRGILVGDLQPGVGEGLVGALDDQRRHVLNVAIAVRPPEAVPVFDEMKGEGRKVEIGAQPDEAVGPEIELRPEPVRPAVAGDRVDAVSCIEQVAIPQGLRVVDPLLEMHVDAEVPATVLHQQQHLDPGHAGEAVAGGFQHLALDVDVDIVPVLERPGDRLVGRRVGLAEPFHRPVGEDDAEAESVVVAVLLVDRDLRIRKGFLHQDREIQASRPAAEAVDLHARS